MLKKARTLKYLGGQKRVLIDLSVEALASTDALRNSGRIRSRSEFIEYLIRRETGLPVSRQPKEGDNGQ